MSEIQTTPACIDGAKSIEDTTGFLANLVLTGVESLDYSPAGEDGELPPNADAVVAQVGKLHNLRDVTIVYEIPNVGQKEDLARSFQNLREFLKNVSDLPIGPSLEVFADALHSCYDDFVTVPDPKVSIRYVITNNIFGLRVLFDADSNSDGFEQHHFEDVFVFNPQQF